MSGGVDSAVAAHLLRRQGHDVAGATMKLFCYGKQDGPPRPCCDMEAIREARRSSGILGIPHTVVDMEEVFQREVIGDFVAEYAVGRTPNPCVRCNTYVKFGPLLVKAVRMGFDAIATGHYVVSRPAPEDPTRKALYSARDAGKDQSYVLWGISRETLDRCVFPLGSARKTAVKRLARRLGLPVWDRAESQDICFVPPGGHAAFVAEHLAADHPLRKPGPVRDARTGAVLGTHGGLLGTTIGQRRGLGIAGTERQYVTGIDTGSGTMWLGTLDGAMTESLVAHEGNLLAPALLLEGDGVTAKIRYRSSPVPCRVSVAGDLWRVRFATPVAAVAPGQSVVFYHQGNRLIGGARILRSGEPDEHAKKAAGQILR